MTYNLANSSWNKSEYKSMQSVIKSGFFTMGKHVKEFEEKCGLKTIHWSGELDLGKFKRFMVVGI